MKEIIEFPVCLEIAKQFLAQRNANHFSCGETGVSPAQEINISKCRKCRAFPRMPKTEVFKHKSGKWTSRFFRKN